MVCIYFHKHRISGTIPAVLLANLFWGSCSQQDEVRREENNVDYSGGGV